MNVIDILNSRDIKYIEKGKDYLVHCFNPEHDDSNPSLRIDKITGIFGCFSCGHKGNIFRKFGAEPSYIDIKIASLQNKIANLLNRKNVILPSDAVPFCRNYRDISANTYLEVNAFTSNEDVYSDRLMFPLYDIRGNIRCFMGRSLHSDIESKYKFFPENVTPPIFPAHPEIWKNSLIIVEGIFDVLNLRDKGCYNIITGFGTTSLFKTYKEKLSHFKILGVNKFYIMFDGDKAGISAAYKLEKILTDNAFNAEVVELPEGKDPGELTQEEIIYIMTELYGNENSSS